METQVQAFPLSGTSSPTSSTSPPSSQDVPMSPQREMSVGVRVFVSGFIVILFKEPEVPPSPLTASLRQRQEEDDDYFELVHGLNNQERLKKAPVAMFTPCQGSRLIAIPFKGASPASLEQQLHLSPTKTVTQEVLVKLSIDGPPEKTLKW